MDAMYYKLEPEVAGGWGSNTVADTSVHPPVVKKLDYEFEGWVDDSIVTTFPCYVITAELAASIKKANFSGYELEECEVSKSDTFEEFYPNKQLPNFVWLKVTGIAGNNDFGINDKYRLIVSSNVLAVIKNHVLGGCEVEVYNV